MILKRGKIAKSPHKLRLSKETVITLIFLFVDHLICMCHHPHFADGNNAERELICRPHEVSHCSEMQFPEPCTNHISGWGGKKNKKSYNAAHKAIC